jgi:hypothetical protein
MTIKQMRMIRILDFTANFPSTVWIYSPMCLSFDEVRSLDDLRTFIHYKLCEKENLMAELFSTTESPLTRRGRLCGLQFSLYGPRSVRLGAIWDSDRNTIYYYDSRGVRYSKLRLKHRLTTVNADRQVA